MIVIYAYQWDTDTPVKIPWSRHDVPTLDFMPDTGSGKSITPMLQDGVLTTRCPPELLVSSRPIQIYARLGNTIDRVGMICIKPRPKPPDYIDTPEAVQTWEQHEVRIRAMEDRTETDPTVPAWAKQPQKPTYTAAEVGALPDTTKMPDALPNPFALNFTGAFSGSYDGTQPVTVEIPQGGGSSGGGGSDSLIVKYVHSDNKVIQPTALDLTTGVFTCVEHGLTTGENAIVIPDACYSYIPFELLSTRRVSVGNPNVRVLDADTFVLQYDGADITYPHEVNTSIDVSKWHIEVGENAVLVFDGFSADSVEVCVHGFYWSTGNYSIEMKPMANNKTIPALLGNNYMSVPGASTTICTFISGEVRIGKGYEMNAFTLSPSTNATDYTYLQKYPGNMGFNTRNVGNKTNFIFPLKREGEITAFRVCMGNDGQFGSLLANGFTVEVYRRG